MASESWLIPVRERAWGALYRDFLSLHSPRVVIVALRNPRGRRWIGHFGAHARKTTERGFACGLAGAGGRAGLAQRFEWDQVYCELPARVQSIDDIRGGVHCSRPRAGRPGARAYRACARAFRRAHPRDVHEVFTQRRTEQRLNAGRPPMPTPSRPATPCEASRPNPRTSRSRGPHP